MLAASSVTTSRALVSTLQVPDGDAPRTRSAITSADRSVATVAGAPLEHAIAYASSLARAGWAGTVGVLHAADGWKLVALDGADGAFDLDAVRGTTAGAVDRLQRHSYELAAVVDDRNFATWTGRQRIADVQPMKSPVVLPTARG